MLGIPSIGLDIDPLSCAISEAKVSALNLSYSQFNHGLPQSVINDVRAPNHLATAALDDYYFPPKIAAKFERANTMHEQKIYEQQIARYQRAIGSIPNSTVRSLLEICLSDALTKKFNIRMMGTGVGRFALEIAKRQITSLMESNLLTLQHTLQVVDTLRAAYNLRIAPATVRNGSATNMPLDDNSISIILTSPPYLPASSGREDYLMGKAISITALKLMTPEQIEVTETMSIGSMRANVENTEQQLPPEVYRLHEWLNQTRCARSKRTQYLPTTKGWPRLYKSQPVSSCQAD